MRLNNRKPKQPSQQPQLLSAYNDLLAKYNDLFQADQAVLNDLNKLRAENARLTAECEAYKGKINPTMQQEEKARQVVKKAKSIVSKLKAEIAQLKAEKAKLDQEIVRKRKISAALDDEIFLSDFGLYAPTYEFKNSTAYKDRLKEVRKRQKDMVKGSKQAADATT